MQIGGFQKLSLIDYPGKVACVIFTQGCNFRCPYCHNRDLLPGSSPKELIPQEHILDFLEFRKDQLQAVVITGGEPTLQPDLIPFLQDVKALGFAVKLDTNGSRPWVLREIFKRELVDFVAMDLKATPDKYRLLAGTPVDIRHIQDSVDLILSSGIEYRFRTTILRDFLSEQDLIKISDWIKDASNYVLQNFSPAGTVLDSALLDRRPFTEDEFAALKEKFERGILTPV